MITLTDTERRKFVAYLRQQAEEAPNLQQSIYRNTAGFLERELEPESQ